MKTIRQINKEVEKSYTTVKSRIVQEVIDDLSEQGASENPDNREIMGVMLESNLNEGSQKLSSIDDLEYGVSITDSCLSWEQSVPLLDKLSDAVIKSRNLKSRDIK